MRGKKEQKGPETDTARFRQDSVASRREGPEARRPGQGDRRGQGPGLRRSHSSAGPRGLQKGGFGWLCRRNFLLEEKR